MNYAEILLNRKIGKSQESLTYTIPDNFNLSEGQLVKVPLRKKTVNGLVLKKGHEQPAYQTREILEHISSEIVLKEWQLKLAKWISEYYFCPLYKVVKLFIPSKIFSGKKLIEKTCFDKPQIMERLTMTSSNILTLTEDQKRALEEILSSQKQITLLHGITGSGKTEIYLRLAEHFAKEEKQSLILVPEISLTPQFLNYFKNSFGNQLQVIHSKLTENQRVTAWKEIFSGKAKVVIGSRSAIFSPFQKLALIVVDEEHEFSYKQENAPRYHTRDIASKMGKLLPNIKIVFGSATPSAETFYLAKNGTYNVMTMSKRIQETPLPQVHIVDLRDEIKKRNFSVISDLLQEKIEEKLAEKEQVILFLNRRGAASSVVCRECGFVVRCKNCDVTMTFHKKMTTTPLKSGIGNLVCHHCGAVEKPPVRCPICKSLYIKFLGVGTQRVEEEILKLFPLARILRADHDTTKKRGDFPEIYRKFKNHEADILIGTQMIGKGLHLPKVSLVGVILADLSLHFPDFRSSERTFQLLTQVAGRAGRDQKQGETIIQTYSPDNFAIQCTANHDYQIFIENEINQRKKLNYPPFADLIKLTCSDIDQKTCKEKVEKTKKELEEKIAGKTIEIFSYPALILKLKNKYRYHILVKGQNVHDLLENTNLENWKIDVNPISTL